MNAPELVQIERLGGDVETAGEEYVIVAILRSNGAGGLAGASARRLRGRLAPAPRLRVGPQISGDRPDHRVRDSYNATVSVVNSGG